jgi:hypothetical protein
MKTSPCLIAEKPCVVSFIEPLESRIAPATVFVTYTDADGDLVKITASRAGTSVPPLDATDLAFVGGGSSGQLATLNLTAANFGGASIIFAVTKKAGGDGLAHVGFINAPGVDLNVVMVKGDLGRITAGDAISSGDSGLNLLSARTMGALGLRTQGGVGDLSSAVSGKLGALKVAGDFADAVLVVSAANPADGQIGSVFIGGDLTGSGNNSGFIGSFGAMGAVRIGGNLTGGTGTNSGQIHSFGTLGPVQIGGDITGGAGGGSGSIRCSEAMGDVRIGGDVIGGAGTASGRLESNGVMNDVRIAGSLIGGPGNTSGLISSAAEIGDIFIGRNLIGGSITDSESLDDSGEIFSAGRIASVTIGGSIISGTDASTGTLTRCGAIVAAYDLGPVKIGRSIIGNSANPVLILAVGQEMKPLTGLDTAIASVTVGGDVRSARVLAGFNFDQAPVNADASIGAVSVGRDWVASSLVAGAQDTGAPGFGIGDTVQAVGNTPLIARIASITIKGDIFGSLAAGDHFGFVAQQIGKLKIGPRLLTLNAGPSNDSVPIPFTDDVRLLEVS